MAEVTTLSKATIIDYLGRIKTLRSQRNYPEADKTRNFLNENQVRVRLEEPDKMVAEFYHSILLANGVWSSHFFIVKI